MKQKLITLILSCFISFNLFSQTIVIDPGHGYCNDCTQSCTSNVRSDTEILTAMSVGDKLTTLLNNCPSVTTYLTRTTSDCGDFPSLSQRAAMSNSWGADRFLSIHCNAGGGSGTETFWCNNSSSSNIACENFSIEIQNQMATYGSWNSRRVVEDDTYLNFHLGVLSPTNAIGCLSEIGFVDSADATKLLDDGWRNQFALAYYVALQNDLGITSCTGLDCASAIPINCNTIYSGNSSTNQSNVDTYGCNTWSESGPERIHTITPTSNGTLTATVSNYTGDLDVYILGSCDPTDCLGTVSSSSASFTNAVAGTTYYIVVDADDGSGSAYDLLVDCPNEDIFITSESTNISSLAPGYDITVTCNQNYTGTPTTVPNSYLYYYLSTDCTIDPSDIVLNNQNYSSLNASTNSDTIIQPLTIPSTTTPGDYNILLLSDATNVIPEGNETNNTTCIPITITAPQLNCATVIPLTCGTIYNGANSNESSFIETYGCNSWSESGPERVHSITPSTNGEITASLSNYTGDLDVYILGSCDPTDCLGTVSSDSATHTNAIAGNTYYIVVDADDGSGSAYDLMVTCPAVNEVQLSPVVHLQGAAIQPNSGEESLMRDDLRIAGLIPTSTPYGDGATCAASVFNATGNDAIVDWIWVELRDANTNTLIVHSQSALLQRDGDVVSVDGSSALSFNTTADDYYIAIQHRNHLGIMTANTISLSTTPTSINFADANNQITFGTDAQTIHGMQSGIVGMWSGDSNENGSLNYLGALSEVPTLESQVFNDPANSFFGGPPVGTYGSLGYNVTDVNMDGVTYYIGALSDALFIRDNIFNNPSNSLFDGPPVGTFTFNQQIP